MFRNSLLIILALTPLIIIIYIYASRQISSKIRKAEEFLADGDITKASEIVKKILEGKKDYVPARYIRATILIMQKQYFLAISELNSILSIPDFQIDLNELNIHSHLATLYRETKQWKKEIDELNTILKLEPRNISSNYRMGQISYIQKQYEKTKECLSIVLEIDLTLMDCYIPLGVSFYYLSDYDSAEKYLLKAFDSLNNDPEASYYLGLIYKGKKEHETAIKMFERSKTKNKFYTQSLFKIGELYYDNNYFLKAIEVLEDGLKNLKRQDKESFAYRYLLSECFEKENMLNEAIYHLEQIILDDSNYRDVQLKIKDFNAIMKNNNLSILFTSSLEELQPLLAEIIARLNYSIISKKSLSRNEYLFRTFNIKRINDPPILIYFKRITDEIQVKDIIEFYKLIDEENCKNGIFISTSLFNPKAIQSASSRMIECIDSSYISDSIDKISIKKPL